MNVKKTSLFVSVFLVFLMVSAGGDALQKKFRKPGFVDVAVQAVYQDSCPCERELADVNAILMNGIWVQLYNGKCRTGLFKPVSGTIEVQYYSLIGGSYARHTVPFSMRPNETKSFRVLGSKILARKNVGVRVRVTLSGTFRGRDCDVSNNELLIRECHEAPLR